MKILKLLSNLLFNLVIIIAISSKLLATEPIDIWEDNSETQIGPTDIKKKELDNSNEDQKSFLKESNIINNDIFQESEIDKFSNKVYGLYDPEENDLSLEIWQQSDGKTLLENLRRIEKINLSKDSENLLVKVLFTNSYPPVKNIETSVFLNYKLNWLIKKNKIQLIEDFLVKNPNLENNSILIKYLIEEYLSNADVTNACKKNEMINKNTKSAYLDKFKIYCLINQKKIDEAQLQYDLLKEKGFNEKFFQRKIEYLLGYTEKVDNKISDKNLFDFHLSHVSNNDFKYEPTLKTNKYIWKYLSSNNLLINLDSIDVEDEKKINLYEKAAAKNTYSKKELFSIYKKFLFSINQLLHADESHKVLPPYKARALIYQSILLTDNSEKKFNFIVLLNELFKKDGIEDAFSDELFSILSNINEDEVPTQHLTFYKYKSNDKEETLKKIKFDNKIIHRSKLLKYFIEENYKIKKAEDDLKSVYNKVRKNKKYFYSAKDIILLDALKSDGIKLPKKLEDQYLNDQLTIPQSLIDLADQGQTGLVLLKIIEIIGEDNLEDLDPETLYFITATLNKLDLKKIRNEIITATLPNRV